MAGALIASHVVDGWFALLVASWILSIAAGVICFLVCLMKPFGWAWPLRRFLALANLISAGTIIALLAYSGDLDLGSLLEVALPGLILAGLLGVPTSGTRS